MTTHIVMWQFKDSIREDQKEDLKKDMKDNLEGLLGQIPGLLEIQFISELLPSSTHDAAMISKYESPEDIEVYRTHPAHIHVADTYVRPFVCNRACLDFAE